MYIGKDMVEEKRYTTFCTGNHFNGARLRLHAHTASPRCCMHAHTASPRCGCIHTPFPRAAALQLCSNGAIVAARVRHRRGCTGQAPASDCNMRSRHTLPGLEHSAAHITYLGMKKCRYFSKLEDALTFCGRYHQAGPQQVGISSYLLSSY